MNIELSPALEKIVENEVASGSYANATEVVSEALKLMRTKKQIDREKLRLLKEAIAVGEADFAAGRTTTFRTTEELKAFFDTL